MKQKGKSLQWSPGAHGNHYNVALPNVKDASLLAVVKALKELVCDRAI